MNNTHLKFDRKFFRDLWQLLKPYWFSEEKGSALGLFSLYLLCTIGEICAHVGFNSFHKTFFNALQEFNKPVIIASLEKYLYVVVFYVLCLVGIFYFHGLLSARWRRWLTKNYLKKWLDNHTHYRMQVLNKNVENPDQRISEDLEKFPSATLSLFRQFTYSVLMLFSFGYILWNLSASSSIPGLFFWASCLYAALGTWVMALIGKALANLDYKQQQYNADFRFGLARLRETSEQVAVYRGESSESGQFHGMFNRIFHNYLSVVSLKSRLLIFNKSYGFAAYVIGLAVSMPFYLAKSIQLGAVMQISSAFNSVNSAFSVFIEAFNDLADWRSVVHRLVEFNQSVDSVNQASPSKIIINEHDGDDIVIENLSLSTPCGKSLLQEIDMVISSGTMTLLNGVSGVGKSTLLRALAGLWSHGEGQVSMPKNAKKIFLPQKPYMPLGSLRDVLLYPYHQPLPDAALQYALQICGLEGLKNKLDEIKNWSHDLSLGEQQLIAFARIFLHKPDVIFLDESTSAMDEETEFRIYKKLREYLPQATIVSVGHRGSLQKFHGQLITLAAQLNPLSASEV